MLPWAVQCDLSACPMGRRLGWRASQEAEALLVARMSLEAVGVLRHRRGLVAHIAAAGVRRRQAMVAVAAVMAAHPMVEAQMEAHRVGLRLHWRRSGVRVPLRGRKCTVGLRRRTGLSSLLSPRWQVARRGGVKCGIRW